MKRSYVIKIGFVVTMSIALLIWGLSFLKGKNIFTPENDYYAIFDKVDGLMETSPVTLNGYKVGQVRKIYYTADNSGRLIVKIVIEKKYHLRKNAIARLYSSDLMGTKAVALIHGNSSETHIPNDTLNAQMESDLKDQVSMTMLPLKRKTEDLLSGLDSMITVFQSIFNKNAQEDLSKSFSNINTTIKTILHTTSMLDSFAIGEKYTIQSLMYNLASITTNLKNNNEVMTKIMANLQSTSDSLSKSEIKATIHQTNLLMAKLNEIAIKVSKGQGSIGALIYNDSLYRNLQNSTDNLNLLLKDFKQNPKRYVNISVFGSGKDKKTPEKTK
jgi:phospholipid/cholesterol/gamma-HCH transport system substrate-binding protein